VDGDPDPDGVADDDGETDPGTDADAPAEPDGDALDEAVGGPPEGDGEASATDGAGIGWTGLGTKTTAAAITSVAVTTPARSPATIARRGGMAGGYQYEAPPAARPATG
jgi:hypothetical protein